MTTTRCFSLVLCASLTVNASMSAQEKNDPLRLVPAQANLIVKIEQPSRAARALYEHEIVQDLLKIDGVRDLYDTANFRKLLQLRAYFEKELGASGLDLLERLTGGGVVLAVKAGEPNAVLLVVRSRDEALLRKFVQTGVDFLKQEFARQASKDKVEPHKFGKVDGYLIGKGCLAVRGSTLLLAGDPKVLEASLALADKETGKQDDARKAKVLIVGPRNPVLDAFFEQEATRKLVSLQRLGPDDLATEKYRNLARGGEVELVIFDRCAPASEADMPQANTFFIDRPPPPWRRGDKILDKQFLNVSKTSHPLLRHITSLSDVSIAKAFAFDLRTNLDDKAKALFVLDKTDKKETGTGKRGLPTLTKLAEATAAAPLIFTLQRGEFTDLVLAFPLVSEKGDLNTDWPLRPSFPLFLLNVLNNSGNDAKSSGSLADQPKMKGARKLLPKNPLVWAWVDLEALRDKNAEFKAGLDALGADTNVQFLFGGLVDVIRRSPFVVSSLSLEGKNLALEQRMPEGRQGMDAKASVFLPPDNKGSLPLLQPARVVASASYYLDLKAFWENHDKLLSKQQVKDLENFDANSGRYLGGTKLSTLLMQAGPHQRLVVALPLKSPYSVQPQQPIPAFALVQEMRDPQFGKSMETVLRAGGLLFSLQYNLKLVEEKHGPYTVASYRFDEKTKLSGDDNNVRFNFSPSFCIVGDQLIVSSTAELAHDLVTQLSQKKPAKVSPATTQIAVYAKGVADVLRANREALLASTILNQALPPESARKQIDAIIALVERLGVLRLEVQYGPNDFRHVIRLQLPPGQKPSSPKVSATPAEMNKKFADPNLDVQDFVKRFENDTRAVYAKRQEIARAVHLRPGDAVADIGAGTGLFTLLFAEQVGPKGTVYAVDIAPAFLKHIAEQVRLHGQVRIVKTVLNTQDSTELAAGSIDVAFVCDTYHHFEHPDKMLASIHRALRPGGRLVVIDFDLRKDSSQFVKQRSRAAKEVYFREIKGAGFELSEAKDAPRLEDRFYVEFRHVGANPKDRK